MMADVDTDNDEEMKSPNDENSNDAFNQQEFEENLKKCRDELSQNANDYNAHLNHVNCLSNIKHINQFRKARTKMSDKFAIPPSVSINFINVEIEYLYYLNDTQSKTQTNEQINAIIQLFKNAIKDYCVDIKLWTNYLEFVFQFQTIIGINEIRENILNEAITSIGHHFYEGHTFWCLYREFETQCLAKLVNKQNKDDTPDIEDIDGINSDEDIGDDDIANISVSRQTEKIRKIWRQQIKIVHFQIEDTYRNYQDWECSFFGAASSHFKDKYNQSKKLSKYFKKWEEKLSKLAANISPGYASMERLTFWKEYIHEIRTMIKHISPKTILNLYERAILDCFLFEQQWLDYLGYIKESGLKYEMISVCERSIRNIALSVPLWLEYIYGCQWTDSQIGYVNKHIFDRFTFLSDTEKKRKDAVTFGGAMQMDKYMQIGIAKCEYYRRRAHCAMSERYDELKEDNALIVDAKQVFEEMELFVSNKCEISNRWIPIFYTFYTDFLSRFVRDIGGARSLWEQLIKKQGKEWNLWLLFIEWEANFGELQAVKSAKMKNNKQLPHGQNNIYRIRQLYHRAMHVLDTDSGLQYIAEKLLLFERMCGDVQSLNDAQCRYKKKLKLEEIRKKKNEEKRMKKKRKSSVSVAKDIEIKYVEPVKKKAKINENKMNEDVNEKRQRNDENYVAVSEKGTFEQRSVFVVNFRKTMNRKDITELFEEYGKVSSIKLPTDKNAKHNSKLRGFGYIEYSHKKSAIQCIEELNGQSVQGKILRVERYRNIESENDANYNTVFVKGLDKNMDQNEANECIKSVLDGCEIKEIRLMKDRNSLKGFGYVEFVDNSSVEKALKCNNCVYQNNVIQVLRYKSEEERYKKEVSKVSSDFVDKLAFKPRSIGHRKSKLKHKKITNEHNNKKAFNQNILNKSNKSPDDFRKLFHI